MYKPFEFATSEVFETRKDAITFGDINLINEIKS